MSFTRGNAYQRAFRPGSNRNFGFDVGSFHHDAKRPLLAHICRLRFVFRYLRTGGTTLREPEGQSPRLFSFMELSHVLCFNALP